MTDTKISYEKSFASHEKSKYWSDKNELKPNEVFKSTHSKFWFDCDFCNHKFETALNNITKLKNPTWCPYCANLKLCYNDNCNLCFEKSFVSHEKSQYWNKEKNGDINPRNITKGTNSKYWFNCVLCNHTFDTAISGITRKNEPRWCNYCVNRKLCEDDNCKICFEKSFVSHEKSQYWNKEKNGDVNPRKVFKCSKTRCWFDCVVCNHTFESTLNDITSKRPTWCPYCTNKNMCLEDNCIYCYNKSFASHEKSKYWNTERNGETNPRKLFKCSSNKYWFDCDKCSHTFEGGLNHITNKNEPRWCPFCNNKTEGKLYKIMKEIYPSISYQLRVDWCKNVSYLPYDFYILNLNIIIELDGPQHFRQIMDWKSPEEQNKTDKYKEKCANENGYSIIRILQEDVFNDNYDWKTELVNNIEKIKINNIIQNIYMCKNNEYTDFN